jgi:hypothetical protein
MYHGPLGQLGHDRGKTLLRGVRRTGVGTRVAHALSADAFVLTEQPAAACAETDMWIVFDCARRS